MHNRHKYKLQTDTTSLSLPKSDTILSFQDFLENVKKNWFYKLKKQNPKKCKIRIILECRNTTDEGVLRRVYLPKRAEFGGKNGASNP